jgi:hypothetical protein
MVVAEKNFWLTTVEAPRVAVCELPERVDVAVIGAGFTGLSAARTLARGGARGGGTGSGECGLGSELPERRDGAERAEVGDADIDEAIWARGCEADVCGFTGVN